MPPGWARFEESWLPILWPYRSSWTPRIRWLRPDRSGGRRRNWRIASGTPSLLPPLELELELSAPGGKGRVARLHFRHVNQAQLWRSEEMTPRGDRYRAAIPADYTHSPYPLQYYFELSEGSDSAWLYPGFDPTLSNQPYLVVRQASAP